MRVLCPSGAPHSIVKKLPSDFEPYGKRSRDHDWGPDCSCDCRWFVPLEGKLRYDWGICCNFSTFTD